MTGAPLLQSRRFERGYVLVTSVLISAVLTLMGFLVLHTVLSDSRTTYADRQSQVAFHLAEAGMAWGIDRLNQLDTDFTDFNSVLDEPPLDCQSGTDMCPCELTGWRPLSGEEHEEIMFYPDPLDESTAIGTFRVVVKDDDDGDSRLEDDGSARDQNITILIRSYGRSNQGSRRMIEATVTKSF
tara:strand:+ start:486 stop:1037 length:552 start_codon:yes stop_codon:yes gene_type:complete